MHSLSMNRQSTMTCCRLCTRAMPLAHLRKSVMQRIVSAAQVPTDACNYVMTRSAAAAALRRT